MCVEAAGYVTSPPSKEDDAELFPFPPLPVGAAAPPPPALTYLPPNATSEYVPPLLDLLLFCVPTLNVITSPALKNLLNCTVPALPPVLLS